jgi:hypothetical protein
MGETCLNELGAKGIFVNSARVLATDDKFGDAAPDMETTARLCSEVLNPAATAQLQDWGAR